MADDKNNNSNNNNTNHTFDPSSYEARKERMAQIAHEEELDNREKTARQQKFKKQIERSRARERENEAREKAYANEAREKSATKKNQQRAEQAQARIDMENIRQAEKTKKAGNKWTEQKVGTTRTVQRVTPVKKAVETTKYKQANPKPSAENTSGRLGTTAGKNIHTESGDYLDYKQQVFTTNLGDKIRQAKEKQGGKTNVGRGRPR